MNQIYSLDDLTDMDQVPVLKEMIKCAVSDDREHMRRFSDEVGIKDVSSPKIDKAVEAIHEATAKPEALS